MKISIITATYNSEEHILDTYYSIASQSFENWEWLVTDDCSSDNTLDLLYALAKKDSRVSIFSNSKNSGAAVSRNRSLSHVTGDFVAFIDSDDLWHKNKLSNQMSFMLENEIDFSFTAYELIDENGHFLGKQVDSNQIGSFSYEDMLKKKATLGCSTVMLNFSSFHDVSMPLIRTGQDYATWLKLLKSGNRAYVYSEVMTKYRIRADSISRNKLGKAIRQWSIYRDIEKLNLIKAAYCYCFYVWRAIFRR